MSEHKNYGEQENDGKPLALNREHTRACSARWPGHIGNLTPGQSMSDLPDEWYNNQCGQCRYYIPVMGLLGFDWGLCSSANSDFDGRVMYEHDGCSEYSGADAWVGGPIRDWECNQRQDHIEGIGKT